MAVLGLILPWIQIVVSVILIVLVLFQQGEAGLGGAFGQSRAASFHQKRGLEKKLFITTIIVATLFVLSAVAALFV